MNIRTVKGYDNLREEGHSSRRGALASALAEDTGHRSRQPGWWQPKINFTGLAFSAAARLEVGN